MLSSEVGTPVWVIEEVDPVLPPGEEGDEELSGVEGDEEEDPDDPIVVEGEEVETDLEEETEIEEEDPTDPVVVEGEETDEEETELETDDEEETDPNNLQGADERSRKGKMGDSPMGKHKLWVIPLAIVLVLAIIFTILGVVCCRMNNKKKVVPPEAA